jgi:hypothetical protein
VATVRIAVDHVGGTRTPCSSRNAPTTLVASATKRDCVSASASRSRAVILRSNTIDVPLATSAQVKVRARNGVTFRSPCLRPKIAQFAAVRWPAGISTRDQGPIGRTRAGAANNDARQGVDDPLNVIVEGLRRRQTARGLDAPIVRKSWTQ